MNCFSVNKSIVGAELFKNELMFPRVTTVALLGIESYTFELNGWLGSKSKGISLYGLCSVMVSVLEHFFDWLASQSIK